MSILKFGIGLIFIRMIKSLNKALLSNFKQNKNMFSCLKRKKEVIKMENDREQLRKIYNTIMTMQPFLTRLEVYFL